MEILQKVKFVVIAVLAILTLIVVFQNRQPVKTEILFFDPIEMPLIVLLLLVSAIGFGLGAFTSGWVIMRRRKKKDK